MIKKGMSKREKPLALVLTGGIAVSLFVMLACSALLAKLISMEIIGEENTVICTGVTLLLSAAAGTGTATSGQKENKIYIGLANGSMYSAILLLITAVALGGQYQGVLVSVILILCASIMPAILFKNKTKHSKSRRSKMRSC